MSTWVSDVLWLLGGIALIPVALVAALIVLAAVGYLVVLALIWVLSILDRKL